MKTITIALIAALFTGTAFAGTGFFGPAAVLKQGKLNVGAEGKYFLEGQDQLSFVGHARYGLVSRFNLGLDGGLIRGEGYFSGYLDYQILFDQPGSIGLTARIGAHASDDSGFRASLVAGNQFNFGSLYTGLDMSTYSDSKTSVYNIVGGIHLPIKNRMAFVGELGFNMNGKDASYFSGGVLYYF